MLRARHLAAGLRDIPGLALDPGTPYTNMVFLGLENEIRRVYRGERVDIQQLEIDFGQISEHYRPLSQQKRCFEITMFPVFQNTAVFAILGAINWIARWYRPEGALQADELGAEFADHLLGGLTCR